MNPQTGENLILLSAVTVMGVETLKVALVTHKYSSRLFVGGGIAFTVVAGVGEVSPQLAGMFAATVMVTVLLVDGPPVMSKLLGQASTKK